MWRQYIGLVDQPWPGRQSLLFRPLFVTWVLETFTRFFNFKNFGFAKKRGFIILKRSGSSEIKISTVTNGFKAPARNSNSIINYLNFKLFNIVRYNLVHKRLKNTREHRIPMFTPSDNKISPWVDRLKKKRRDRFNLRKLKGFSEQKMLLNTDRYIPQRIKTDLFGIFLKEEDESPKSQTQPANDQ